MNTTHVGGVILAACFLAAVGTALSAQARSSTRSEPAPGLPDWSGAWIRPFEPFAQENSRLRDPADPIAPRLAPASAALLAETRIDLADPDRGGASTPRTVCQQVCRT
jgi:hypothetical protein